MRRTISLAFCIFSKALKSSPRDSAPPISNVNMTPGRDYIECPMVNKPGDVDDAVVFFGLIDDLIDKKVVIVFKRWFKFR